MARFQNSVTCPPSRGEAGKCGPGGCWQEEQGDWGSSQPLLYLLSTPRRNGEKHKSLLPSHFPVLCLVFIC